MVMGGACGGASDDQLQGVLLPFPEWLFLPHLLTLAVELDHVDRVA